MGDHAEAARLWATALGAGVLGAVVGGLLMRGQAAPLPAAPAIELAPIEAALRDLQSAVQPAVAVAVPEPERQPVREPVAEGSPSRADLDAGVQRVVAALHALAERLEKIAAEDHGSAQLVAMVQEMGELPRGVPANRAALDQLAQLGEGADRAVAYSTPRQILERFGGPDDTGVDSDGGAVYWSWSSPEFYVVITFVGGRVVGVDAERH